MQDAFFLTSDDREILKQLIHEHRLRPRNVREYGEQITVAGNFPDVYVAKLPNSGIPARSGNVPGVATCDIYKIDITTPSTPTMTAATSVTRDVYNVYPVTTYCTTASSSQYVRIQRDKFGRWLCERPPYRVKAKSVAAVSVGGSGTAAVYIGTTVVGSVTAYLNWMAGGSELGSNKEGIVEYFEAEGKWVWTNAECET